MKLLKKGAGRVLGAEIKMAASLLLRRGGISMSARVPAFDDILHIASTIRCYVLATEEKLAVYMGVCLSM